MVFDSRYENTLVIVGSDLFDTAIRDTLAEKGSDIIRFNCEDGSTDDPIKKRLKEFGVGCGYSL